MRKLFGQNLWTSVFYICYWILQRTKERFFIHPYDVSHQTKICQKGVWFRRLIWNPKQFPNDVNCSRDVSNIALQFHQYHSYTLLTSVLRKLTEAYSSYWGLRKHRFLQGCPTGDGGGGNLARISGSQKVQIKKYIFYPKFHRYIPYNEKVFLSKTEIL